LRIDDRRLSINGSTIGDRRSLERRPALDDSVVNRQSVNRQSSIDNPLIGDPQSSIGN
jgi:hypothetical protein